MLGANQMIDYIEHRRLLSVSYLTSHNRDYVCSNPLSRKMLVDLVPLDKHHPPPWLSSARNILGLLLNLYPLVVYHSRT